MAATKATYRAQAKIFAQYLVNSPADKPTIDRFTLNCQEFEAQMDTRDARLLELVLKYPWLVGYIDAGLGLVKPHSELRRRIYIMFALLESSPDHWRYFLPVQRSRWYIFVIMFTGFKSVLTTLLGIIIVKAVKV
ncbi:hypothetical protein EON76_01430 [bacterium]|nr:MAG: hypothetical protein EON76_01430 [bacterium]